MIRLVLIGIALSIAQFVNGQIQMNTIRVSGIIADKQTQKPLSYVRVYCLQKSVGTLSSQNGYFELKDMEVNDSIVFSYLGYDKLVLTAEKIPKQDTIFLSSKSNLLNEVQVYAEDEWIYKLITTSKKTASFKPLTAKTYFQLESYIDKKQVELIECYYNGIFNGYELNDLLLKQGRFALAPYGGDRLFISTETTRAFILHRLFDENDLFPVSPLQLSKKELRKKFKLVLLSCAKSDEGRTICQVSFKPRDTARTSFEGMVWLDSLSGEIHRVTHRLVNAATHPFAMIARPDGIQQVDLEFTETFIERNGSMYINSIDFDYQINFKYRENDSTQKVRGNAVLYAYDYEDRFDLPKFNYTDGMYGDYVKILATPYNIFFWKNQREFSLSDDNGKNERFFLENGNNLPQFMPHNKADSAVWRFEKPYIQWSKNRVVFREDLGADFAQQHTSATPYSRYELTAQIYLDVNLLNDTLHALTSTIFDPYATYFYYSIDSVSLCFINMYFDLREIHRRILEREIQSNAKTVADIFSIYQDVQAVAESQTIRFFSETERGMNRRMMESWNEYIVSELQIDNIALFGPYD